MFLKNQYSKKHLLSPANTNILVTLHFNLFLNPNPSSERIQEKLTNIIQNKIVIKTIQKIQTHFKKILQNKLEKQMLSIFISENVNL